MGFDLDDLDRDLEPSPEGSPEEVSVMPAVRRRPRRDGIALAFGLAFVVFGVVGLVRAFGGNVPSAWLYPIILIGLGLAGLVGLAGRER